MKKKKTNILLFSLAVVFLAGMVYLLNEYYRAPAHLSKVDAVEKLTASQLMQAFAKDENWASRKYAGKVVEVTGNVSAIHNEADTLVQLFLKTGDPMHQISCMLAPSEFPKIKRYELNQKITIKGFCTGYLMDVELNRCLILNEN